MTIPQTAYVVLSNPTLVWILLFFVNNSRPNYAQFVWDVIDYMRNPDKYWDVFFSQVS